MDGDGAAAMRYTEAKMSKLAGEMLVVAGIFLGIVTVDSPELHTALTAPLHGLIQQLVLTDAPEDELVAIANEHLQGLNGKGSLLTYLGVTVLDNRTVKIYCYYHFLIELSSFWP